MIVKRLLQRVLLFSTLLGIAGTTFAQVPVLPQQRLAKTTGLSCTFAVLATGTWADDVASAVVAQTALMVTFTNVNVDEGTADAAGAFVGASLVTVRYSNGHLHLIQTHRSGAIYTTTVFAKETRAGRLLAVHTRHEYADVSVAGLTSSPEMYLGDCALPSR